MRHGEQRTCQFSWARATPCQAPASRRALPSLGVNPQLPGMLAAFPGSAHGNLEVQLAASKSAKGSGSAQATLDHDEIRRWVESHGGHPAMVKRTARNGRAGILRIDFPGYSGERSLEEISW